MSSSVSIFAIGLAISAIFVFWGFSSTSSSPFARNFPRLYHKRICLLIAHPDDEAMFFSPTVLALTRPELGNHLKILCLSNGNADGLGRTRAEELHKSARKLGLRDDSDVFIVDDPERFPDSMQANWSASDITSVLASAFAPDLAGHQTPSDNASSKARKRGNKTAAAAAPVSTIDVLLTFDHHGVSNHPNHRSLYHGAVHFLRSLMKDKAGFSCPVALYTLTTTNILRKYMGVFDAPATMLRGVLHTIVSVWSKDAPQRKSMDKETPGQLLFVSSVNEYLSAQSAMVNAHKSQMVWFRWGWITIGRYMVVNDLRKQRV